MNEPSIGVSVGGAAPMTRSPHPDGSMRLGSVDGNAGVTGREVESAMNESVISARSRPAVVSGATRDG
jgi:hypothetical protein